MNILICYMPESELLMQSYGATNMSTWTENIRDLEKIQPPRSRVTIHAREPRTPARRRWLRELESEAARRAEEAGVVHGLVARPLQEKHDDDAISSSSRG